MGTIENIMNDPKLCEESIRVGMQESATRKRLQDLVEDPPKLHNCILEIQADDGTWHERDFADWLLCLTRHGGGIARVRYPNQAEQ